MKVGRLRHPCNVLTLQGEPPLAVNLGMRWCDIGSSEGDVSHQVGLRQGAPVIAWARWDEVLRPGRYLQLNDRLWHIDNRRDPKGRRADMVLSLTELVGEPATWYPAAGGTAPLRIARAGDVAEVGELWQGAERLLEFEVALIEGRPERGDEIEVGGIRYSVEAYNVEASDAVVWRYKVIPV